MHHIESKLNEAFNQTSVMNNNYGAFDSDPILQTINPRDDAYDRYVSNPFEQ